MWNTRRRKCSLKHEVKLTKEADGVDLNSGSLISILYLLTAGIRGSVGDIHKLGRKGGIATGGVSKGTKDTGRTLWAEVNAFPNKKTF